MDNSRTDGNYKAGDLMQAIDRLDMIIRPYAVYLHPDDYAKIKAIAPEIEDKLLLVASEAIEKGKAIQIKRELLKTWAFNPSIDAALKNDIK